MKALSLRQPWATLVIQGHKTLELRTWQVGYRGPLAIHASQTVDRAACQAHGLDPDLLPTGAVLGVVELVAIAALDEAALAVRRQEHLAEGYAAPLYGWELARARALARPLALRGRMGLFSIPDEILTGRGEPGRAGAVPQTPDQPAVQPVSHRVDRRPAAQGTASPLNARYAFELRVAPEPERGASPQAQHPGYAPYRLALWQRAVQPPAAQAGASAPAAALRLVAELGGSVLRAVADQVLEALRQNGYQATDLAAARREPFALLEETGVRLGLLFLAVRPLSRMARVEAISAGLRAMTSEELYYWFSKCASAPTAERAQRALRVLLAGD